MFPSALTSESFASAEPTRLGRFAALGDRIFAVATFDSNGILERSEFRAERQAPYWTEAIFSAIGFKGLLDATLNHRSFRHAKISGKGHVAFLVRRRRRYVALLSEPLATWEEEAEMRACLREMGTGDLLELMWASEGRSATKVVVG